MSLLKQKAKTTKEIYAWYIRQPRDSPVEKVRDLKWVRLEDAKKETDHLFSLLKEYNHQAVDFEAKVNEQKQKIQQVVELLRYRPSLGKSVLGYNIAYNLKSLEEWYEKVAILEKELVELSKQ